MRADPETKSEPPWQLGLNWSVSGPQYAWKMCADRLLLGLNLSNLLGQQRFLAIAAPGMKDTSLAGFVNGLVGATYRLLNLFFIVAARCLQNSSSGLRNLLLQPAVAEGALLSLTYMFASRFYLRHIWTASFLKNK